MRKGDVVNLWWCRDCHVFLDDPAVGLHWSDHTMDKLKLQVIERISSKCEKEIRATSVNWRMTFPFHRCRLEAGHAEKHNCYCGYEWSD